MNEVLAHLTRNVCEHVVVPREIDAKHVSGNTWVTVPSVTICSSFGMRRRY